GKAYLSHPPSEFWRALIPKNWGVLRHLPKIATTQTFSQVVERFFSEPHLRQLFMRFATYNGSSPYRTPTAFAIIPFVESEFGGWYVRGGVFQISKALGKLALAQGVVFHHGRTATRWEEGVLTAEDGSQARPDFVVCNGDAVQARLGFLAGS